MKQTKRVLLAVLCVCLMLQAVTISVFQLNVPDKNSYAGGNNDNNDFEKIMFDRQRELQYIRSFKISSRRTSSSSRAVVAQHRNLKFFHIPKSAGTAVEFAAGKEHEVPWGSCLFDHKPVRKNVCYYPTTDPSAQFEWPMYIGWWHIPMQFFPISNSNPYHDAEIFAIVRDPYERLISEFYYICKLKDLPWRPNQCNQDQIYNATYMNEWIQNKLNQVKDHTDAKTYIRDNGHFTSQYDFIVHDHHQVRMVDYVLEMNEIQTQFHQLMNAYQLNHIQLSNEKQNVARNTTDHLTELSLNEQTLSKIHTSFQNDFNLHENYQNHRQQLSMKLQS